MIRKTTFSLAAVALLGITALTGCAATGEAETENSVGETEAVNEAGTDNGASDEGADVSGSGAMGGSFTLKVSGTDITLDDPIVACQEQGGQYALGVASQSASAADAAGFGAVLSGTDNPTVVSVAVVDADGRAVAYAEGAGMGSADVKVDGKTYTITGTGIISDLNNPTSMEEADFEFSVTCP
ncbi:lipoprotein LpqH [uncultured Gulosibacter sp.]|uniref:lipoprotein LpqH n=1 Tax=uncultured Gulosibacter sp. TaxID=1339167 RepID=UPI00288B6388|nr:lipoprotein LpqH [uncultured Gulosibacter sp.]